MKTSSLFGTGLLLSTLVAGCVAADRGDTGDLEDPAGEAALAVICPDVSGRVPQIMFRSVLFPAPFGPMMQVISPGAKVNDTSWTAR